MAARIERYMTISVDIQPEGINLGCWMSSVESFNSDGYTYPFNYAKVTGDCLWKIRSSSELTVTAVSMVLEMAERIRKEQQKINDKRKVVNR